MIYVTGDTHGDLLRFQRGALSRDAGWGREDTLLICGDFGFLFYQTSREQAMLDYLAKKPYTICFVCGNHENFTALNALPVVSFRGGSAHQLRPNIFHLMRGQCFIMEGQTWFTFGGAYSIDRFRRTRGLDYWEEELPSPEEYRIGTETLRARDMAVDYILTHTAPRSVIERMGEHPDPSDLRLTTFLDWIWTHATFRRWYFGHWHRDQEVTERATAVWTAVHPVLPRTAGQESGFQSC